jgi:hypothetical protein
MLTNQGRFAVRRLLSVLRLAFFALIGFQLLMAFNTKVFCLLQHCSDKGTMNCKALPLGIDEKQSHYVHDLPSRKMGRIRGCEVVNRD